VKLNWERCEVTGKVVKLNWERCEVTGKDVKLNWEGCQIRRSNLLSITEKNLDDPKFNRYPKLTH